MYDREDGSCASGLAGLTSQISLLMLRSASLPNGYGFEFAVSSVHAVAKCCCRLFVMWYGVSCQDRALGRVVLRHAAGVVIHGQALLPGPQQVKCNDGQRCVKRVEPCFVLLRQNVTQLEWDSGSFHGHEGRL